MGNTLNKPIDDNVVNFNFIEFFSNYDVEIPLIQRDYVQGSNVQSKKRDEFIDSLFDALLNKENQCELDFIYGTFNNGEFLPLDGQQRLTTLFLLHWFLINKCRMEDENTYNTIIADINWGEREFKYKTRRSSTVFCEKLMKYQPEYFDDSVSKMIEKQSWFSDDWKLDPTVHAMLDMLDALNNKYLHLQSAKSSDMLSILLTTKNINFDKLDMGAYKLNDSLYVKMNARGKQLTTFENWKAKFIKFIEERFDNEKFASADKERGCDDSIKAYFTHSIEHEWTDLFWTYAVKDYKKTMEEYNDLSEDERAKTPEPSCPVIDDYFLNFYYFIYRMLYFSSKRDDADEENEDLLNGTEKVRRDIFSEKDNIEFLYKSLDIFSKISKNGVNAIEEFFNSIFYLTGNQSLNRVKLFSSQNTNLFEQCINNNAVVDNQILLYCILIYCIKYECFVVSDELITYVRVCRNLIESITQRLTKDMKLHSNVRFSQFYRYLNTINDLCSDKDVKNVLNVHIGMGDTDGILSNLNHYNDDNILLLEDSEYTHGCLYAFDLNQNPADIYGALEAFRKAEDTVKVKLLVAFGFEGAYFGNCAHGERRFFGYEDRWDVIFRYEADALNLNKAFSSFVECYKSEKNIDNIIKNQFSNAVVEDSFGYYVIKYTEFCNSSLQWEMDDENFIEGHHFFAISSPHIITTLSRFSSNPLKGYHTNPYISTVAQLIKKSKKDMYKKLCYTGENRQIANISFHDNNLVLSCTELGWKLEFSKPEGERKSIGYQKLLKISNLCESKGARKHFIKSNPNLDRIELAVDFLQKLYCILY